jgi:4-amino-4-deoxy-L-arabinose transferase-like glycosyltransferase
MMKKPNEQKESADINRETGPVTAKKPNKLLDLIRAHKSGITVSACLVVLCCAALATVKGSPVYGLQNALFGALHMPLNELFLNGHKFFFPPYFFYDVILAFIAVLMLYGMLAKKTAGRQFDPWKATLVSGYFMIVLTLYCSQVGLFLADEFYELQVVLWLVMAVMAGFYCYRMDKNRGIAVVSGNLLDPAEERNLFIFAGVMLLVYMWDFASWKYSFIGDEYAFYEEALGVAKGSVPLTFFYESGVYGYHPLFPSIFSGALMKIFGTGLFGWKLSSAVVPAASIIPLYIWAKLVFKKRAAIIAAAAFAFSASILAFSHIGYDNIHAVFPFVLSLLFAELAIRKNSSLWSFAAGLVMAMGCYTFYSARLTVLVVGLYWFFHPLRRKFSFSSLAAGLSIYAATIFFIFINPESIRHMLAQTVFQGSEVANPAERPVYILLNFVHTFFSFIVQSRITHFMSGSAADWLTGIGVLAGLAWTIVSFKKDWRARWMLLSYVTLVIFIGAIAQYTYAPNTRIYFLAPLVSILAGVGLSRLAAAAAFFRKDAYKKYGIVLMLIPALLAANNIYGFYIHMPRIFPFTAESYVVKYMREKGDKNKQYTVVTGRYFGSSWLRELYNFPDKFNFMPVPEFGTLIKKGKLEPKIYLFSYDAISAAPEMGLVVKKEDTMFNYAGAPALYACDLANRAEYAALRGIFVSGGVAQGQGRTMKPAINNGKKAGR